MPPQLRLPRKTKMKKPSEVFNKIRFSTMQEKVNKPTGELKDACWKGYTAVGMKMKDGKKVPNCVPTNESKDMKSMRIIKDIYKRKSVKEETDTVEKKEMVQSQLHFIKYACEEIIEYIEMGGKVEEWYQVKLAKSFSEFESLHAFMEGESRRLGMKEQVEQVEEGMMKSMATDAEETKRLGSWRKETPWMKVKDTITDKSGAKHTPMSRARDLARSAAKKNVKESVSIDESRLADIVREAAEKAKKKKKEETKKSDDTFQAEPELSSQIIRND
jgi:hypothetical protein